MHLARTGPEDAEPIVLVHGAMVAGWMWRQQVQDLPEYRCLVPDLPGFGHSGHETWQSLADTADQVAAMIHAEAAGSRAHVVGLSLGGLVALHLAVRHPTAVRSTLVSGVPMGELSRSIRAANALLTSLYVRPRGARLVARAFGMPDEESREAFVDTAARTDREALRRIQAELRAGALPDLASLRDRQGGRLLAVVGSNDTALARNFVAGLPALVPWARTAVVPAVGHQWNAERPELFSDLVRAWITERPLPAGIDPEPSEPTP